MSFLTGKLAILLAEPGQGKTYMSRYLASTLASNQYGVIPLVVDSTQWSNMSLPDLASLWKTVAHTFRHYGATIGWIENHEDVFLKITLKADLFRTVFDGFDEYILRNAGAVQPLELLETLADLADITGTRIVITSRTSFWETNLAAEEVDAFIERTGTLMYRILPFDLQYAENYFKKRFEDLALVGTASSLFRALDSTNDELTGRGFVLNLLGDIVERGKARNVSGEKIRLGLKWLIHELCEREQLRQRLPFTATEQEKIFCVFAHDIALGDQPTTDLLELAIELVRPDLDSNTRHQCLEKFKSHPLATYDLKTGLWNFKEKQVEIVLIAGQVLALDRNSLCRFFQNVRMDAAAREDLASILVSLTPTHGTEDASSTLQHVIGAASQSSYPPSSRHPNIFDGQRLAASIALISVEKFLPHGSSWTERTLFLRRLCNSGIIDGFVFGVTIGRFDLRGVQFRNCVFEKVTWAHCLLDKTTIFQSCCFTGRITSIISEGFGKVSFSNCILDQEATDWLNAEKVREGQRQYSSDDLKSDFRSVLNKFVIKGGLGLKTVDEKNLTRGTISRSPQRDAVIEILRAKVFERHHISGKGLTGYNVRQDVVDAMKFFAGNNVLTGELADAFEKLRIKLEL